MRRSAPPGYILDPARPLGLELHRVLHEQVAVARKAVAKLSRKRLQRAGKAAAALERVAALGGLLTAVDPSFADALLARTRPLVARVAPWRDAWAQRRLFAALFDDAQWRDRPGYRRLRAQCRALPRNPEGVAITVKALAANTGAEVDKAFPETFGREVLSTFSVPDLRAGLDHSFADCVSRMRRARGADPGCRDPAGIQLGRYALQLQLLGALAGARKRALEDVRRLAELLDTERDLARMRAHLRGLTGVRTAALYQPFIDVVTDHRQVIRLQIESLDLHLFGGAC